MLDVDVGHLPNRRHCPNGEWARGPSCRHRGVEGAPLPRLGKGSWDKHADSASVGDIGNSLPRPDRIGVLSAAGVGTKACQLWQTKTDSDSLD